MTSKILAAIMAHPAVHSVSDERALGEGCWVFLKDGFESVAMDCGSIHEPSWTACYRVMREGIRSVSDSDEVVR
jgi:hypothetical protein